MFVVGIAQHFGLYLPLSFSPITYASTHALRCLCGVVELLLKQYPQAVYIQNQYGNLPLHCATAYQAPSLIVGLLLQVGW